MPPAGADEIVLLDITATHEGRGTLLDTVKRTAAELFVPFTVGGGIRTLADAAAVFNAGADKVSINSSAIARPELIGEIGASFGAQAVIVAIDARRSDHATDPVGDAEVYVSGGRKPTGLRVIDWAREAEQRGAGEILLTSMDTDGMSGRLRLRVDSPPASPPPSRSPSSRLEAQVPQPTSPRSFRTIRTAAKQTPPSPPASSTSASPTPAPSNPNSNAPASA